MTDPITASAFPRVVAVWSMGHHGYRVVAVSSGEAVLELDRGVDALGAIAWSTIQSEREGELATWIFSLVRERDAARAELEEAKLELDVDETRPYREASVKAIDDAIHREVDRLNEQAGPEPAAAPSGLSSADIEALARECSDCWDRAVGIEDVSDRWSSKSESNHNGWRAVAALLSTRLGAAARPDRETVAKALRRAYCAHTGTPMIEYVDAEGFWLAEADAAIALLCPAREESGDSRALDEIAKLLVEFRCDLGVPRVAFEKDVATILERTGRLAPASKEA